MRERKQIRLTRQSSDRDTMLLASQPASQPASPMSARAWRRAVSPPESGLSLSRAGSSSRRAAARCLRRGLFSALLGLPLLLCLVVPAAAQTTPTANADGSYTVPGNWALKPSTLTSGDKFRLLFISSTTTTVGQNASFAQIDTFVRNRANAGHASIRIYGDQFKVVGSSGTVDARDHTGTTHTADDLGVPIYWLGGDKLADHYMDFYDGSWDSYSQRDEGGTSSNFATVATGSYDNGTKRGNGVWHLGTGSNNIVRQGNPRNGPPFDHSASGASNYVYGISPVFVVGTDSSESSTLLSNTGQQEGTVAYSAQSGPVQIGQRIRTGSHAAGYDLDSVVLKLVDIGSTPAVTIHGNSASNEPVLGSTLYTLTNPSTVTAGLNEFSAPADATLEADTDYWVILSAPGNPVTWRITTSTNLDAGAAAGWQISNGNAEIVFGQTTVRTDGSYQLQVKGAAISSDTVAPTVEIGGLSGTSGAVTVTISFSEDVTGFTVEDIAVSNGAVSNFAGSGAAYTATITPADGGMVTSLVIAAGAAADAANNGNKRATANNATVSRLAAPAPLTATPGDGRVALSWTVTADNTGFAAATRYQYRFWAVGGSFTEWMDVPDKDGDGDLSDETAHVVAGLANDVNHLFQVRAVNGAGAGAPASVTAMPSAAGDTTAPTVVSIKRRTPSTSPTSADSLTWRVTFSESVTGVDGADLTVTGSTATAAAADSSAGVVWDVTASGGDLESLEGAVTLGFASGQDIVDASGNALDPTLPAGAETAYTVDNTPDRPTGADRTVTTKEDTAYAFTADDFGFVDADEGDTLAGIRITALETAGALKFSADVTLDQVISKAQIDTGLLTFTPAANANGPGYATFGFKVSDGALESAAANTITIDVTAVNDAPTGLPAIAGIPSEGDTLTAATDAIADADGLGTFGYQWKRDGTAITGATSSTYTLAQADVGSAITVTVSWTDDGGTAESATSAPTAMVTLAPLTVTLDTGLGGVLETAGPVTVTITFSAAVTGFAETDLAAVRGTVSDFTEVTSGTVWTVRLTPNPDFNGRNVDLTVPAGAAVDANGNGNKRARTSVRYLAPLRAPRDFTATPGDARATLAWTAPANDGVGLAAVSKYQYQYHPAGGPWVWWRDVPDGDGDGDFSDETSFTLGGLQNGTRYHFQLRALNGAGEGAATAIFSTVPSANTATDGVTVSESSLALTEGHASDAEGSYTVALDTDPGATVSIAVSSDDASAATVSPSTLTFTGGDSGTWGTAQKVTVTAQEDGDAAGETVTVSHAATVSSDSSNPYHQITVADVSVTLTDAGHGVLVSESSLAVNAGASATYKLRLKSQPGGSVVIAPTSSSTAGATVSPATLTFTNANWDQEQTVTVTGVGGATTGTATVSHAITTATTAYPATQSIASVAVTLRNLTLDPTTIPANSLNGATVTLIPKNMSFIGAGPGTGQRDSNSLNWAENDEGNPIIGQLSARAKALFTLSGAPDGLTISDVELLARETGVHGMPAGVGHRSARITLAYSGSAVTMDETVTVSVASEHFREYSGTFRGFDLDAPSFSASFTISPGSTTNAAPTASNGTVTVDEDGTHTFAAAEFGFMDADTGDTLASVRITTLETAGDLEVDGTDATLDQVVTKADIDANK
ncbi:MAG: hypothetical protein F4Y22_12450, partial [Gammaproteobacteria bacterium]|nr:hypothetical protein [Gammaproteobacteria bacterium]